VNPIPAAGIPGLRCPRSPFASLEEIRLEDSQGWPRPAPLYMADGALPPPELATSVRCFWNDAYLFSIFCCAYRNLKIISDLPESPADRRTPLLWERSDVVEVFIGAGARDTGRYCEIQVAPDGRWMDMRIERRDDGVHQDPGWASGIRCTSFIDASVGEWRSALAVPWKSLDSRGAGTGAWDCNFYRASGSTHGDELLAWAPTGYGNQCFHRPEKFGRLELLIGT